MRRNARWTADVSESNIDDHAKASTDDCRGRHEAQPAMRRSVRVVEPSRHEQSALQDEAVSMCRYAEPVQEPFEGIARKQYVERLCTVSGEIQQPCAN
jgi:hypothetical protein